ncbi:hypothetical protein FOZ63_002109, partial [Perkinsus olseni]
TIADLNQLPYVECCILETLRLQPPAVFLLNECIRDTVLDGKRIPCGTVVATLFRKAMVAESQGGKTFKPQRWLTHDGSAVDQSLVRDHLAFGGTRRKRHRSSNPKTDGEIAQLGERQTEDLEVLSSILAPTLAHNEYMPDYRRLSTKAIVAVEWRRKTSCGSSDKFGLHLNCVDGTAKPIDRPW